MNKRDIGSELPDSAKTQAQWDKLISWTANHSNWRLSQLALLLKEMTHIPESIRFYPYTSHFTLCLSTKLPPEDGFPRAEALEDGRFRVFGPNYVLVAKGRWEEREYEEVGEGDAQHAAELIFTTIHMHGKGAQIVDPPN